jgi:hypothetical protein
MFGQTHHTTALPSIYTVTIQNRLPLLKHTSTHQIIYTTQYINRARMSCNINSDIFIVPFHPAFVRARVCFTLPSSRRASSRGVTTSISSIPVDGIDITPVCLLSEVSLTTVWTRHLPGGATQCITLGLYDHLHLTTDLTSASCAMNTICRKYNSSQGSYSMIQYAMNTICRKYNSSQGSFQYATYEVFTIIISHYIDHILAYRYNESPNRRTSIAHLTGATPDHLAL